MNEECVRVCVCECEFGVEIFFRHPDRARSHTNTKHRVNLLYTLGTVKSRCAVDWTVDVLCEAFSKFRLNFAPIFASSTALTDVISPSHQIDSNSRDKIPIVARHGKFITFASALSCEMNFERYFDMITQMCFNLVWWPARRAQWIGMRELCTEGENDGDGRRLWLYAHYNIPYFWPKFHCFRRNEISVAHIMHAQVLAFVYFAPVLHKSKWKTIDDTIYSFVLFVVQVPNIRRFFHK